MKIKPHSFYISAVTGGLTALIRETNPITLMRGKKVDRLTFLDEFTKTETSDYRWDFHTFGLSLAFPFPHKAVATELKVMLMMIIMIMMMMMITIIIIIIIIIISVALRPNAGHGLLIHEVSRSHTTTHHSR